MPDPQSAHGQGHPSNHPAPPPPPPPPATTTTTASASAGTTPGPLDGLSPTDLRIKLEHARKNLRNQLDKKRKIDRDLATLEHAANASGSSSSASGAQFGNIIRGYDSYLKAPSSSAGDRRKVGRPGDGPNDKERMFSASSATYHRSIELRAAEAAASVEPESDDDASRKKRRH